MYTELAPRRQQIHEALAAPTATKQRCNHHRDIERQREIESDRERESDRDRHRERETERETETQRGIE